MRTTYHAQLSVLASLEEILDTVHESIHKKHPEITLQTNSSARHESTNCESLLVEESALIPPTVRYAGVDYKTTSQEEGMTIIKLTAKEEEELTQVAINVEQGIRKLGSALKKNKPEIVNTLIDSFSVYDADPEDEVLLRTSPFSSDEEIVSQLFGARNNPTTYITRAVAKKVGDASVDELARELAGRSHVIREEHTRAAQISGEGVFVSWPDAQNVNKVWSVSDVNKKTVQDIATYINDRMQLQVISQDLRLNTIRLFAAGREGDASALQDLLDEQIHTLDRVRSERTKSEEQLKQAQKKIKGYERKETIRTKLRLKQDVFSSLAEAVHYAADEFNTTLIISPNVFSNGFYKSPFKFPDNTYKALEVLATTYREAMRGGTTYEELNELFLQESGFSYRPHQDKKTMKQFPQEYSVSHNKQTIWLPKHLRYSAGGSHETQLRIGFNDVEDDAVLVGFIGKHQKTRR